MIRSIPYSSFDLAQLITLSDQSYKIVQDRHSREVLLVGVLKNLSDAIEKARPAVGSTTKEALTEQVRLNDARRDDNYAGMIMHIEAGLKRHSMPSYQGACERLKALFDKNGGRALYRYSYSKQTASMESLFKDLESKQAQTDIETINATKWLKELKADHEAFKKVYAQRDEEEASKNIPTNEEAAKLLKPELSSLLTVVDAFHISRQIEGIQGTIDVLNETIDRAVSAARQSSS